MAAKRKNLHSTEQLLEARKQELDLAFSEMTETIDNYMRVSPFQFIQGDEAQPGEYVFNQGTHRFSYVDGWTERWLCALCPRSIENQQKRADGKADDYADLELAHDLQHLNFVIGVLVGCASMGADRAVLRDKAEGFITQQIGYERWELTQQRSKSK